MQQNLKRNKPLWSYKKILGRNKESKILTQIKDFGDLHLNRNWWDLNRVRSIYVGP